MFSEIGGRTMKKDQLIRRRDRILEMLVSQEEVRVSQLLTELQISDETLRKDLIEMEHQGMVARRHGRVSLAEKFNDDSMSVRELQNQTVKKRIAKEVLRHIPEGHDEVVGLDVGSTVYGVAKLLGQDRSRTIVTNSLDIVSLYAHEENPNIYCTGGVLRTVDRGLYGNWTRDNLKGVRMTVAVLGTPGIMEREGIGAISFDDREMKQLYARNSQKVIAAFDSTKGIHGAWIDGVPWEDIDLVITDKGISDSDRERIERKTELILV